MKKIIITLAIALGFALSANAQEWAVGGRIGSGLQVQGEYAYNDSNYIEARFGMAWNYSGSGNTNITADFSLLHNWNVCTMDWTPSAGTWFFDAGVGVTSGGSANFAFVGVTGCAKLGIRFFDVPLKLSLDFSPSFGPEIGYIPEIDYTIAGFSGHSVANLGISAVYCF